ncbi:cytochrome c3 family protein [Terracidiphilus sp.]|uniref:cytochrome c3 family protein n=1 Tax=Terracidiphilus sp. TaxID=1964191 RepID=UPI003C2484BE
MAQIFDRNSNALARMSLVLTGLIVIALGVTLDQLQRSPWVTRQGQRAEQPVPFSHKHHVQGLGLQCQYCHTTVEKSSYAGIPPTKTCMNCHAQIWTNAQLLEPVRQSWATDRSINWIRVHDLPDFAYFNHEIRHLSWPRRPDAADVCAEYPPDGVVPRLPSQSGQEHPPNEPDLQHGLGKAVF